ncbi:uncharacterized protein LOC123874247 [Maniola jurtina]|uniref:uncharacterized protein LOC123874247 n=1 Tax=Maniola jurtina TaxID=191418 RepID=UPI001E68BEE8|nr:uncharacterized protein LOC123874247 [Maniola jurtina]
MRLYLFLAALVAAVVITECKHTFLGTNVQRQEVFHENKRYFSRFFEKRVEDLRFRMPYSFYGRAIQGILAYDKNTFISHATVNVTEGGLGFNYVTLRMASDSGHDINYDIFIYA